MPTTSFPSNQNSKITRTISLLDGVCLVVGLVVGIGIYQTPPLIASHVGNEFELYLIWILGALLTLAGALCYIELAATYPEEGGDYLFLKLAYGRWSAFLYGWSQVFLIRPGAIAAVAFPFATYIKTTFPSYGAYFEYGTIEVATVLTLTLMNIIGTTLGVWTQNLLTIIAYLLLFGIALGGVFLGEEPLHLFQVADSGTTNYGLALILVLFTYGGWSELALVAGEVDRPRENFLRSMLLGIFLVTLIYCTLNFAFCRTLGFEALRTSEAPAAGVLPQLGTQFITFLIALCCLSSLNALILASSRISLVFGRDFSWFRLLGYWNSQRNSPVIALMTQGLLSVGIILLSGSLEDVLVYTSAVVWLFYLTVGLALFRLRRKDPRRAPVCPTWGYPFTPIIFCCSCLYLIHSAFQYDARGSTITFAFVLLGLVIFFAQEQLPKRKSP